MLQSKHYYIDLINSSKANQFTAYYHYSGVGFKKASINQGIFRIDNNKLVGVLQWGCSAQTKIKLDRYVKEPMETKEYLELNRFCMDNEEGHNAESEAIALGIKWIKQNRKDIRLLVSYAGRKEGNYGYIYQATNWEYLGYFISNGFWIVDGRESHQLTLWSYYKRHCNQKLGFIEGLCNSYHQVIRTWSKQFIYIKRLDKKLTPATAILPYPKPATESPICTRIEKYKNEPFEIVTEEKEIPVFYYEPDEMLFTRRALIRQGVIVPNHIAIYYNGDLEDTVPSMEAAKRATGVSIYMIKKSLEQNTNAKEYTFRYFPSNTIAAAEIDANYICKIDDIRFFTQTDIAKYCGVSKQAVSKSVQRRSKTIAGKEVFWKD